MSDWQPMREFLRECAERWLDDLILRDPDRQARAFLAARREEVLQRMVDKAEAVVERECRDDRELERLITSEAPCETMQ